MSVLVCMYEYVRVCMYVCIYILHNDLFTCSALNDSSQTSFDGNKLDDKYHFPGVIGEWRQALLLWEFYGCIHVIVVHMEEF